MEGSVADLLLRSATDPSIIPLSEEGVTHRNVGDYYCHLSRHPFVSQIKYIVKKIDPFRSGGEHSRTGGEHSPRRSSDFDKIAQLSVP